MKKNLEGQVYLIKKRSDALDLLMELLTEEGYLTICPIKSEKDEKEYMCVGFCLSEKFFTDERNRIMGKGM